MIIIVLNGSIKWDTIAVHSFWFTVHSLFVNYQLFYRFNKLDEPWVTRMVIRLYIDILCVHNAEGKELFTVNCPPLTNLFIS